MILAALVDLAFVTAQNEGVLSIIDLGRRAEVASLPLAGKPAPVACRPGGGAVVVEPEGGIVSLVSAAGRVEGARKLGSAFGAAATADGIFVTDWDGARLLKLDPVSLETLWSVPTGRAPTGVDSEGGLVAVAERDDDSVALFDAATGALHGRAHVGAHPFGVTLHGPDVLTADVEGDSVSVVRLADLAVTTIPVGDRPYAIAFQGDVGAVTNAGDGTVSLFRDSAVVATVPVGENPEGIAATSDGGFAVANWFSNTVTLLDAAGASLGEIETPDGPRAFGRFVCP